MKEVKAFVCGENICIDQDSAKNLVQNVNALQNWIDDAWHRCGPTSL